MRKLILPLVFAIIASTTGFAQSVTVKGVVTDAKDGSPIPGVSIEIHPTSSLGTVTDIQGKYNLEIPKETVSISFSFMGMKTQTIPFEGQTTINIKLEEETHLVDEIVVTGYQKIDRKLFTGSAVKLKAQDVKIEGITDPSRLLQGTVSGVEVENVSGTFGTAPVVRIRGSASVLGSNRPLMVVDGVVLEDAIDIKNEDLSSGNLKTILSSSTAGINPDDIESFEVLKDASATALYGARAMNGVIVITTKKGVAGAPVVTYTLDLTMRQKPSYSQFDYLSSGSEMAVYQELYEKGWIDIASSATEANHGAMQDMFRRIAAKEIPWGPNGTLNYDYLQRYADANTDWFDLLFTTSVLQQHSLSISQGSDKAMVRASLGFLSDPGQTIADNVKNYTGAIRADFTLSDKLKIGGKVSGNVRDQQVPASENRTFNTGDGTYERNFDINPFNYALYTSRSITPYNTDGTPQYFRRNYAPFNIIDEVMYNKVQLNLNDLTFQTDFNYQLKKNLSFNGVVQARWYMSKTVQSVHEKSNQANAYRADDPVFRESNNFLFEDESDPLRPPYSILPTGGLLKTTTYGMETYMARVSGNYSPIFRKNHALNFLFGGEIRSADRTTDYNEGWGYIFDQGGLIVSHPDLIKFLDQRGENYFSSSQSRNRSVGVFINSGYSYKGKYIVNITGRYDGDNRTGMSRQARYLPTWNVSGAWNVASESFMESTKNWLDLLKLKATYGLSGDNPAGKSASAALLIKGAEPLRPHLPERETSLYISSLANQALTFEKLYEFNLGVEASFLNRRFFTEIEYWNRYSKDLIGYIETSGVGGEKSKYGNVGEMKASGVDVALNSKNIVTSHFQWNTNFTFSYSTDKITKWYSRDRIGYLVRRNGGNVEGYSKGSLFSIPFAGLDNNGVPTFYRNDGSITQSVDLQERNNVLSHVVYEGPTTPKYYGGLSNTFSYKNLHLNVGLVYRYGSMIRLDDAYKTSYNDYSSLPGQLINRWQFEGDEAYTIIPAILDPITQEKLKTQSLNPYPLYNKSNVRVAKGDFIRLKNVSLTYNLPHKWLQHTFIKSSDLTFSGYNLALLYSDDALHGIDPEFFQSGGVAIPLSPSYTFALKIKF